MELNLDRPNRKVEFVVCYVQASPFKIRIMSRDFVLIGATLVAIIGLIILITRFKVHAFLALILASIFLGLAAGLAPDTVIANFATGFGDVMKSVGIVVGFGSE